MKNKKGLLVFAIVVVLTILILGLFEYKKSNVKEEELEISLPTVVVSEAKKDNFVLYYETSGKVSANTYKIGAEMLRNSVSKVFVKEGDSVKEGDVLLSMDIAGAISQMNLQRIGMRQSLIELKSSISQLEKKKEDMQKMYEAGVVSKNKLDEVVNSYDNLKLKKEGIIKNISALNKEINNIESSSSIHAKKSGIVSKVKIKENQIPNMDEYIEIKTDSNPEIKVYLTEDIVKDIFEGIEIEAIIDGETYKGTLNEIHSISDMEILYPVDIELDTEKRFKTIETAKVKIPIYSKDDAILVDRKAIIHFNDEVYLFKVVDNKAVKTIVEVGETMDSFTELRKGVKEGDKIIVEGQFSIVDGEEVEIVN